MLERRIVQFCLDISAPLTCSCKIDVVLIGERETMGITKTVLIFRFVARSITLLGAKHGKTTLQTLWCTLAAAAIRPVDRMIWTLTLAPFPSCIGALAWASGWPASACYQSLSFARNLSACAQRSVLEAKIEQFLGMLGVRGVYNHTEH